MVYSPESCDAQNEHEQLRHSKGFQDELKFLERVNQSFLLAFMKITAYSSRSPYLHQKSLLFTDAEDILQSALSYVSLVREGILNVPRRELRYVLETVCVHYIVDRKLINESFADRVTFLESLGTQSALYLLKETPFEAFNEGSRQKFSAEVLSLYRYFCGFVHPSKRQIEERLKRYRKGRFSGFEGPEDIRSINRDIFRTLDIILAVYFHALSLPQTGDIFIQVLDSKTDWKFHKGKWCSVISKYFDYKIERQQKG